MKCRCGATYNYPGHGKRLCPPCLQRNRERSRREASYPKCNCGATLGMHRVGAGIGICGVCADRLRQAERQRTLNNLADTINQGGW